MSQVPAVPETCESPELYRKRPTGANTPQFEMQHDEWQIKENITQLKQLMSDKNLQLLPDYEQRVEVLRDLGFVDSASRVQLKGKVACEVRYNPQFSMLVSHMLNHSSNFAIDSFRRRIGVDGTDT